MGHKFKFRLRNVEKKDIVVHTFFTSRKKKKKEETSRSKS